jgi:hypothetical protein
VFLLAKTSDEFNKMAKVRAEMEALLAEFNGHVIANTANNADVDVSRLQTPKPRRLRRVQLPHGRERAAGRQRSLGGSWLS